MKILCLLIFALLQLGTRALDQEADEDSVFKISCNQPNHGISINSATWTYNMGQWRNYVINPNWRNLFILVGKPFNLCTYDEIRAVKEKCQAKESCEFTANREVLSDNCNYWMVLKVNYDCLPCDAQSSRHRRMIEFRCDLTVRMPLAAVARGRQICPNERFDRKHVCTTCSNTVNGAQIFATQAEFVRLHGDTSDTGYNSIFITSSMLYTQNQNQCTFGHRASKYNCQRSASWEWTCTYQGEVFATHDLTTGHYDPSQDY